jgi:hypothetical protein
LYVNGTDNGFRLTVPANTQAQTLKLYLSTYRASGRIKASLSDGSAPIYVGTVPGNNGAANTVVELRFSSASSSQTLQVDYTLANSFASAANVGLQAAALAQ